MNPSAKILLQAERNIRLYVIIKVFVKRVFLPLSAIYFVQVDHFTIRQIGLLAAFFAAVQLVAEVPTGFFADKFARVTSIRIGAALNIIATLLYALVHTKLAVFSGQFCEALGYSFIAGAGEALIHDSLTVQSRADQYSKVLSRAQAVALVVNAGLIALVPMTYHINKSLPFLLGTLAYGVLLAVALRMADVPHPKPEGQQRTKVSWTKIFSQRHIIGFFVLFGLVGALYTGPSDMFNLALKSFGLKPEYLGWLFAIASLVAAAFGPLIHLLRRLPILGYVALDLAVLILEFAGAFTGSLAVLAVTTIISLGFWRYRKIIYQDHLLTMYPTRYKATLLSIINNVEQLNLLWIPILVATTVTNAGYAHGLGMIGLMAAIISPLYFFAVKRAFKVTNNISQA